MELPAVDGGVVLSIGRTVELPEADTGVWCYL